MIKTFRTITALGLLSLAACAPATETGTQLREIISAERGTYKEAKCEIPEKLVGQSHTILNTMRFDVPIRVIFPGDAVTTDHVANRLNFKLNSKGVIKEITCG